MNHPFPYEIIYSNRKTLAIQIGADGHVTVRAPKNCPQTAIDYFLQKKERWIQKHIHQTCEHFIPTENKLSDEERMRYIQIAREIITQKTAYYAALMHVTYGRISIREQKTRWGSCSGKGNLNFNWRLILAPENVLNYVVVHELAHRKEMNHSPAFYAVVQSILPDYKTAKKWLRDNGQSLWTLH